MSFTNYAAKEINFKIVYYGPGLAGKTTNLRYIFDQTSPDAKGKLLELATEVDRYIFFDFLPAGLPAVRGFTVRVHLYTVPGEVLYDASRKEMLKKVDGVVFVADSRPECREANQASLQNLTHNLTDMGADLARVPFVIQYNKRDVPDAIGVETLRADLNANGVPDCEAVASRGTGVFATAKAIIKLVVAKG
jgi:signal recognition particle receptor subunit beta